MTSIAIIGAGAIGSAVGAYLSRIGEDVTLIARRAHVDAVRRDGLKLDAEGEAFTTRPRAAETLDFRPDYTFLTVKTQDVLTALQPALAFIKDAPIVTFQNGVRSDELVASLLPRSHITSAVVNISATYLTPGAVTVVYPGTLMIGHPVPEAKTPLEPVQALLNNAAPTTISQNIMGAHWLKLLFNLNNAFPAMLDISLHQIYALPYMRALAARVIREGLRAVDAAGIRLASLPEVSVGLFRMLGALPPSVAGLLIVSRARRIESDRPLLGSTLQSLRRGRPTEVDYLNGEIVHLGQQTGRATPINARLVELVHEVEGTGKFMSMDELKRRVEAE